jgi:RNA polymerase sigma-70 factor (ECF subfamily)
MNELQKQMDNLELEFTRMVQEYRKTIYTVCYFFSDNPTDVDDLFQEVLVNLWKGYPRFRGESGIKTWVWRVSLNTCCAISRGEKRRIPTVPLGIEKDILCDHDEASTQIKMLYDRINKLEVFDRAIILLWLESMSYDEIAAIVGLTTSAVTSRLFRIKEQLKSMSNN